MDQFIDAVLGYRCRHPGFPGQLSRQFFLFHAPRYRSSTRLSWAFSAIPWATGVI
jgi:hypothetical protein